MHNEAGWLSEDAHALQRRLEQRSGPEGWDCDLLIVGSGYGAAVAAARFAGARWPQEGGRPISVIVVERGREYLPGTFPSRFGELAEHVRFSRQDGKRPRGSDTALWDFRMGDDVNVVLASGLGGGSLINAAVMERPEPQVWHHGWPEGIDGDRLEWHYREALRMLEATPLPPGERFDKLDALQELGRQLPERPTVQRCTVAITHATQGCHVHPDSGVLRKPCTGCGDCATGCNQQAKHSLDTNYLALAKRRGASLYCGVLAHRIERTCSDEGWLLHWTPMRHTLPWAEDTWPIRARCLIIGAGSLGSTELLQRSQTDKLRFSPALGSRFSTNGDMLAASMDMTARTHACGKETEPASRRNEAGPLPSRGVGPTILGQLRSGQGMSRFTVQEFAVPAPLRLLLAEAVGTFGMLQRLPRVDWSWHRRHQESEDPLSLGQDYLNHTLVYGLMGDDGARGRLEPAGAAPSPAEARGRSRYGRAWDWLVRRKPPLPGPGVSPTKPNLDVVDPPHDGCIVVQWPGIRTEPVFEAQHQAFADAHFGDHLGTFVPNPLWRPLPAALDRLADARGARGPVTTVHPLGGCPMSDSVLTGVVDACGRVYDGGDLYFSVSPAQAPPAPVPRLHGRLAVLDGAIVPRALGINPALTITALAEQAVPRLMAHWGIVAEEPSDKGQLPPLGEQPGWRQPAARHAADTTGIRISEELQGALVFAGRRYWADLEVRLRPVDDVVALANHLPRIVPVERATLRLHAYRSDREDDAAWHDHRDAPSPPLWTVQLSGEVELFHRHRSWMVGRILRGGLALWRSRHLFGPRKESGYGGSYRPGGGIARTLQVAADLIGLSSQIGERRGMQYRLRVETSPQAEAPLQPGDALWGEKRLDCSASANPWQQVSRMHIRWRRAAPLLDWAGWQAAGRMDLNLEFLVRQRAPLASLARQSDHATALGELGVLLLLCLRVLVKTQLLSFIPPRRPTFPRDIARRLPGELPGLCMDRFGPIPQRCWLLTRYRSIDFGVDPCRYPVLLIHGYTASGSTYTHPSIQPNLVQELCRQRREVWVVELSSSIAFPKHEARDLGFEAIAHVLPDVVDEILRHCRRVPSGQAAEKVDVIAHCIGAAMFCREVLHSTTLHKRIGSAVLSQVGPLIRMTPANLLRGFMASYLLQFASIRSLDARPDAASGAARGIGQVLLDALLASHPYPDGDLDRSAAARAVTAGRPDFRLVRHRADAMLGRLMELREDAPIADETLDALDDIFGYARVLTLAQVIMYARYSMLTDADGRNREVSHRTLRERMNFPVLLLHGRRSGVFDWRGSLKSYEWLRESHADKRAVDFARIERNAEKMHLGLGTPRQLCVFEKFGHQDTFIGRNAPGVVYPVIERFLQEHGEYVATKVTGPTPPDPYTARLPWTGPIAGWLRPSTSSRRPYAVSLKMHPAPVHTATRCVAVLTMTKSRRGWSLKNIRYWDSKDLSRQPRQRPSIAPIDLNAYLRQNAATLHIEPTEVNGHDHALLFLTLHDDLPDGARITGPHLKSDYDSAIRRFLHQAGDALEEGLLRLHPEVFEAVDAPRHSLEPWTFVVASCQYPNGLLDRDLADASYGRLAARLAASQRISEPRPQTLLLLGDQVYVDETAGVFEPAPLEGQLDWTYERAFRARHFRATVSRLPTLMMLDDHEVQDNWQPKVALPVLVPVHVPGVGWVMVPNSLPRPKPKEALARYVSEQAALNPKRGYGNQSFQLTPGGWPLFVLDTRSTRQPRSPSTFDTSAIANREALDALHHWLDQQGKRQNDSDPHAPKFLASPLVFLPFERSISALGSPPLQPPPRWTSDAWAAYPGSRNPILQRILSKNIRNVVFLSGDAHLSMFHKFVVDRQDGTPPLAIYAITSSGLYAPWRFANARPEDFFAQGTHDHDIGNGQRLRGMACTHFAEGASFAIVTASVDTLRVRFDTEHGTQCYEQDLTQPNEPIRVIEA